MERVCTSGWSDQGRFHGGRAVLNLLQQEGGSDLWEGLRARAAWAEGQDPDGMVVAVGGVCVKRMPSKGCCLGLYVWAVVCMTHITMILGHIST